MARYFINALPAEEDDDPFAPLVVAGPDAGRFSPGRIPPRRK
jgi:hypothetical protein